MNGAAGGGRERREGLVAFALPDVNVGPNTGFAGNGRERPGIPGTRTDIGTPHEKTALPSVEGISPNGVCATIIERTI